MGTQQQDSRRAPSDGAETRLPILGVIEALERLCTAQAEPAEFVRQLLVGFVAVAEAPYGAFWQVDRASGELAPSVELSPGVSEAAARQWRQPLKELAAGVLEQSIIRYRGVSEPAEPVLTGRNYTALGLPVPGERVAGCITVVAESNRPVFSGVGVTLLRLVADLSLLYSAVQGGSQAEDSYRSLSGAWEMVGETLAFTHPREMAQVLADRSRGAFGARRVSVGFVDAGKVRVSAVSGEDVIDRRSNVVRLIEAAQQEVVISGEPGLYDASAAPEQRAAHVTRNPQQERLARAGEATAAYSVPLRRQQDLVAVWSFEFGEGVFSERLARVIDVAAGQMGPLLHLARLNSRGPLRRVRDAATSAAKWVFGREHPWRRVGGLAIIGALAYGAFGVVDFRVSGGCRLEPSLRRIYSAPFGTRIESAPVRPGDTVEALDTLVDFDRLEVDLSLREAKSKREGVKKEVDTYLVQEDKMAEYAEASARLAALEAEIDLLERRLSRTSLKADFAGIVLSGDLTQEIGRPVQMGEPLIEVAPLDEFVLEVEIDQGDVSYLREGQAGRFTTKAKPDLAIPFSLLRVRPMPEARGGQSRYVAEAVVPNTEGWLRPGMEGAAKIDVGRRNVTWTVTRKLLNWLKLKLWW
jgi:hypothetical protein